MDESEAVKMDLQAVQDRLWFVVSCLVFYWSLPLTVAFGEWSHSYSNRNDIFVWCVDTLETKQTRTIFPRLVVTRQILAVSYDLVS